MILDRPATALRDAYGAFTAVVNGLDEDGSWLPTGCTGWAVRDLVFHCLADAQRGLVALHTPASGLADRDAVTYWQDWEPGTAGAANGRRWVRVSASMFLVFDQLRELYAETAAAAATAAEAADEASLVRTQGHVLTAADLVTTLAVEATVHHLDLTVALPDAPPPSAAGLAAVRATLDGLLGRPVPVAWSDERYARAATGRAALTAAERAALGEDAGRFPLFG
ncbi:Mycothiol maleylpyruvate isomerase N-terminal domain-containing protein [Actinacidiphila alni]|uniref:Mycothiol maleylpyruvate isomerase N-terminal domain-containing protein n=1 Tax=Actinacidiphila alni TaxID=380248 RepID=A0A1I2F875_9ACTN|nr:maleylpyruvate isomerase N-terminal domain-containing protein [Actinacidiphila alni]SFF01532.1 Mycothiol maleylpyruvate isomerase N-terminal domain-containing protein [Actinacidiphila alni]